MARFRLLKVLVLSLVISALTVISPSSLTEKVSAAAANSCTSVSSTHYLSTSVKIEPLHGKGFYVDLKNGFNASYIGYKITNRSPSATLTDLWLETYDFRNSSNAASVLSLANSLDSYLPIGDLAPSASRVVYVLVKASSVTEVGQLHDVRVHKGYPRGSASMLDSGGSPSECSYTFTKVLRTLAASANKVNSIGVSTTSPTLGDSVVVTIKGVPGQSGSGSTSPDGDVMWLSGASSSLWPTRALRLEKSTITINWNKSISDSFEDVLLVTDVTDGRTGNRKFTSKASYTATFTFRVMGATASNPIVKPVAQIASGTQIKHTGSYPSILTTIGTSSIQSNITSMKTVDTFSAIDANGFREVSYRVVLTDTKAATTVDVIVDDPDTRVTFVSGSARITDSSRTSQVISNPLQETQSALNYKYTFGGPFQGKLQSGSYVITLTYKMLVPANSSADPDWSSGSKSYVNSAFGQIGSQIIGKTSGSVSGSALTYSSPGATPTVESNTTVSKPKLPQTIDFPQIPTIGTGQSIQLDATASSGLPITYSSSTPAVCTVSGNVLTILTTGTCTIVASQGGNDDWDPAQSVTQNITPLLGQIITFDPKKTVAVNGTETASVTSNSGLPVTVTVLDPSICKLMSGASEVDSITANPITIKGKSGGTCVLVATQAGNGTYAPALPVERNVSVGVLQEIIFTALNDSNNNTGTGTLTAYSRQIGTTTNTNLPITFVPKTPDVCDVTADVTYTKSGANITATNQAFSWTKAGICIFSAIQDGLDENGALQSTYAPAEEVTRSFRAGNTTPTIVVTPSIYTIGSGGSFSATVVVTVPSSGTLAGRVVLYASGRVGTSFEVQEVTVNSSMPSANSTSTSSYSLTAGTLPTGAPDESIALSAAFVTSNATFTSTSTINDTFVAVTAPSLSASTGDVSSVTTNSVSLAGTFNPQSSQAANVAMYFGTDSNAMDTRTVSSPAGATGTGTSNINVSASVSSLSSATKYFYEVRADRDNFVAKGGVKSFVTLPGIPDTATVSALSNSVVVTFDTVTAGPGVTIEYTVTCTPTSGSAKTATGSASPITVTGLGSNLTYNCAVKANSSASGSQGGGFGGERTTGNFQTTPAKQDRALEIFGFTNSDPESRTVTVTYGETISVYVVFKNTSGTRFPRSATNTELGAGALTFTRATGSVCAAEQAGTSESATVTFSGVGTCTFTATIAENTNFAETTTAVSITVSSVAKQLVATAGSHTVTYGDPVPTLSATVTGFITGQNSSNAAGYVAPTCATTYTDSTNAETSGLTVTCSGGSATNYTFSYVAGSVTVNKANQVVTLAALNNMVLNDPNQSTSTTNDKSQSVNLATLDLTICDIVGNAVRAKAVGICTVTASSPSTTNFNVSNTASQNFTITASGGGNNNNNQNNGGGNTAPTKLNPTITWVDPADIFNPTPLGPVQLNAVGSVPGVLVYTPALGTVLPVGRHTLSVSLNPTDSTNYNSVSTTVRIRVLEQRFQTILTWSNPAPIVYPTPLTSTQLNARANTPGRFTYNPAAGTILNPGTHTLTVNFIPTLSSRFQAASTQVTILVTGGNPEAEEIKPTPENPIVVDTRPNTTPGNSNQGNNQSPNNPTPKTPVILVDTKTVSTVEVTEKGKGVTNAEVKSGKVEIAVAPTFSGKTNVEVTYVQNDETKVVVVPLVVPPAPPTTALSSPESMEKSTIKWAASPNAISYDVYVREKLECQVATTSCEVPFIVGPATPIRVVAIGGDETQSDVEPVFKQEKVIPALTVNFATASFRLSAAFKRELRDLATIVAREGFTSLIVYGHTDSRAFDNRTLSRNRAQATRDYLAKLLPGVEFKVAGFAATQRVAEENSRAGLAENRRAEVRIAG